MLNYIDIKYKFIPNNIINTLLQYTNSNSTLATVGYNQESHNENYRNTQIHQIPLDIIQNIKETVFNIHELYIKPKHNTIVKSIENPQLLSYGPGGKYDKHNDSMDYVDGKLKKVVQRDWTMIWYLNEEYTGGELEFCQFQIQFKPKAGDIIIFPSYSEFEHAVIPVTSGKRMCLVTWIETENTIYPI